MQLSRGSTCGAYGQGVPGRAVYSAAGFLVGCGALSAVLAGCGSSNTIVDHSGPTPSAPSATSQPSTHAPTTPPAPTTAPATQNPATRALATGPKSATCVNGWIQPAPGSDFFQQATAALEQSQGGTGYAVKAVRYFAGPLASGGIGAVYYLDVNDPRLTARVVLVSGGGAPHAAVAKPGTTGWKPGEWTGFGGTQAAALHPPTPGKWAGPEFDAVTATPAFLSPSLAGCLQGT